MKGAAATVIAVRITIPVGSSSHEAVTGELKATTTATMATGTSSRRRRLGARSGTSVLAALRLPVGM
jgi:hypothetical protein